MFIRRCKMLEQIFLGCNTVVRKRVNIIASEFGAIKLDAARRLLRVWRSNKVTMFDRWRDVNARQRQIDASTDVIKKGILMFLERTIRTYQAARLKEVVDKMRRNLGNKLLQRKYLDKFLRTKIGMVKEAYDLLHTLPLPPSERYKAFQFERGLREFIDRPIKLAWARFKGLHLDALIHKERIIEMFIQSTAKTQKKMYHRWSDLANRQRLIE